MEGDSFILLKNNQYDIESINVPFCFAELNLTNYYRYECPQRKSIVKFRREFALSCFYDISYKYYYSEKNENELQLIDQHFFDYYKIILNFKNAFCHIRDN